jgi:CorA-like Mg2+ transporter protein
VIEFQRATGPLDDILAGLIAEPGVDEEAGRYLRDVQDHALRAEEQADAFRALLQNILSVNLTLETKALTEASHAQNEQVKRISAWAAILFAPTVIGTIYGMNFEHMPELGWRFGYPSALALMVLFSVSLYLIFKRRRWICAPFSNLWGQFWPTRGLSQQPSAQPSPRQLSRPSLTATPAMKRAARGSAHQSPATALRTRPMSNAMERYAQS